MARILEFCWACTEPIFEGELLEWAIPRGLEHEEPFHGECRPTDFFIEEDDVFPLDEHLGAS